MRFSICPREDAEDVLGAEDEEEDEVVETVDGGLYVGFAIDLADGGCCPQYIGGAVPI